MKIVITPTLILRVIAAVVICFLLVQNFSLASRIDKLKQQQTSSALEKRMQDSEYRILSYQSRIDSLFKIREGIQSQLEEIRRQNSERIANLQGLEYRIIQLKKQLDEKPNYRDSSIHAIDNILPR